MKIGVMGTGGVGGYFGGLLASTGHDIHFVARGKHLQAIEEGGLQLSTSHGDFQIRVHATSEPHEIGPVDLVLFCVKSFDTAYAADVMEPMVEEDTIILSLQNGIDNLEKLTEIFGPERILGGTAYIEATIVRPGIIHQSGPGGRLVFGELDGSESPRANKIVGLFRDAGIEAELREDIQQVLWRKFMLICGIHGVSTASRAPIGLVLAEPETRELLEGVMREVEELGLKKGVEFPPDVLDQAMAMAESYPKGFKSSMLRDLEWRRPMEIESLNGLAVRLGRDLGVATPLNQALYACVRLENRRIMDPFWAKKSTQGSKGEAHANRDGFDELRSN